MRLLLIFCLFLSLPGYAQTYWQQEVNTRIDVRLDDKKHFLHGYEEIEYVNNSPDTLKMLYLHLWPNAYRHDHTPFALQYEQNGNNSFYYAEPNERGYIDSLEMLVNGESAELNIDKNTPDIGRVTLRKPLLPGAKLKLATPFRVKLPEVFSRMGHNGQAYFAAEWFPKPAVYDRKGWHPISYLDQGEFYSEYGSYDVSITLPANYIVMATGNCTDATEQKFMDSLANAPLPDTTKNVYIASSSTLKTVHFHEDSVHDFAWFADKRWIVRKLPIISNETGNLITAWSAYLPTHHKYWKYATRYLRQAVRSYERNVGAYPYKTIKAALGDMRAGGGMEYPTVTLIDKSARVNFQTVVVHEAGHNWFYGLLGSNERDHPWMDEGLNTFYERKTKRTRDDDTGVIAQLTRLNEDPFYYELAKARIDQPFTLPSELYSKIGYGLGVYYKTAIMFEWLEAYMGNDDFRKGMRSYYRQWRMKHPYPNDFETCMRSSTTKSLDWFFDTITKATTPIDYSVTNVRQTDTGIAVVVRNRSGIPAPVKVDVYGNDTTVVASGWSAPFTGSTTIYLPGKQWKKIKIDTLIPDARRANNVYRNQSLFKKWSLQLKPFFGLNMAERDRLFIAPAAGVNEHDGIMAGILLHNLTIPENKFRFALAPMYSFVANTWVGAGSIGYAMYPIGGIRDILVQIDGKTFHDNEFKASDGKTTFARYVKTALAFDFHLNEANARSTRARDFVLKAYYITQEQLAADTAFHTFPPTNTKAYQYLLARYTHVNSRTFNPFSYQLEAHGNEQFAKLMAEGNVRVDYNKRNKALRIRAFAGKYLALDNNPAVTDKYQLNSSYSGVNDYLYDGTWRGRNELYSTSGQQIALIEGGFKIPVNNGVYRSDNWLGALNLSTDLPLGKLPLRFFFDVGMTPNFTPTFKNNRSTTFLYDGGVELYLIGDVVSIYVPFIMSSDFRQYINNTYTKKDAFWHTISFRFDIQRLNWMQSPTRYLKTVFN